MSSRPLADFTLGINFPWVSCGHDFGPRPSAWAGAAPNDWAAVERELGELASLGLSVARWWILAGGVNLPVGADVRRFATRVPYPSRSPLRGLLDAAGRERPERWSPRADLPALPRAFLADFERLLLACARTGVRLLPSLLSFELLLPIEAQAKGVTSRGRSGFVLGDRRAAFLDTVLEPLLEVCERHRGALAAFEIVNEPDWAVAGRWVSGGEVGELLVDAARRVARRDLRATVGFFEARPSWLSPSVRTTLGRLAERGAYVHQLHHYPKEGGARGLPPASQSPIEPCWVGELPTARGVRWPDAGLAEDDDERYLERRIEHARELGYAGALLWAHRATDRHVRWDARTKAQVRRVARGGDAG